MIDLIVTRHPNLLQYIIEQGIASEDTPVIEHATEKDVRGLNVCGILPHHMSSLAASITEIPLNLSLADRKAMQSRDLTISEVRRAAGKPVTYKVEKIKIENRKKSSKNPKKNNCDIKRTEAQISAEKKSIDKFINDLKSDKRSKWKIIKNDKNTFLVLRAPLNSDTSGYSEYGWKGPFRYLEESYRETGPFGSSEDAILEIGLNRSAKVLSKDELEKLNIKSRKMFEKATVDKCRFFWELYIEKPDTASMELVLNQIEKMRDFKSANIKREMNKCLKAANSEIALRGWVIDRNGGNGKGLRVRKVY